MFKLPLLRDTVQHLIWDICVEFTFVQRVCLGVSVSDLKRNKPKNLKYFEVRQLQTLVYNHTRQRRRYIILVDEILPAVYCCCCSSLVLCSTICLRIPKMHIYHKNQFPAVLTTAATDVRSMAGCLKCVLPFCVRSVFRTSIRFLPYCCFVPSLFSSFFDHLLAYNVN